MCERKKNDISIIIIFLLCIVAASSKGNEPVKFVDVRLKEVIESKLGISNPTPDEMLGLTELQTKGITDLSGLEYAKNLTKLQIDNTLFHSIVKRYTERRINYL